MSWPTTADGQYYLFDGQVQIPIDPSTGVAHLILRPQGGIGVGIPPVADGAPGLPATFQEGAVDFTELAWDDPTQASLTVTQISLDPPVYALSGALHSGPPGEDGTTSIDLGSIGGTPVAGQTIKVNGSATGFDFTDMRVADRCIPASISNTAAGNASSTLCPIVIPSRNYDRRLLVAGHTIYTQNGGSNVVVDFVARLNNQSSGNVIARCQGLGPGTGGMERLTFSSASPPGSADGFNKVPAGSGATVYIRTEQQSGSNSYTTSNSTTLAEVWAFPVA